jgi:GTP pyrophosphokinase
LHLPSVTELYYQLATEKIDRTKLKVADIIEAVKTKRQEQQTESKTKATANNKKIQNNTDAVLLNDEVDLPYTFAKCCSPIPGDDIFGFVTVGEGVKIHRTNCPNAIGLMSNYGYRIIRASWANSDNIHKAFLTTIRISGIDSVGIISTITDIISKQLQINMHSIQVTSKEGTFEGAIELEVYDTAHLDELMNKIKGSSPLIKVQREDAHSTSIRNS